MRLTFGPIFEVFAFAYFVLLVSICSTLEKNSFLNSNNKLRYALLFKDSTSSENKITSKYNIKLFELLEVLKNL